MKLINQLQNRFLKTQIFKRLLHSYEGTPEVRKQRKQKEQIITSLKTELEQTKSSIPELVKTELWKAQELQKREVYRFRGVAQYNSQSTSDHKPFSSVPFSYLRSMAVLYPIARACINRRIRQITQLEWDITTMEKEEGKETGFETQIAELRAFFKQPMGHKTRMRELLTMMIDDVLTLDAVCFEISRLRGGKFNINGGLIPVDPSTIVLRVTEYGATPEPPEIAYAQIIQGDTVAKFTTDEMIYEMMGSRSYSPYGLAPLESLILQAESAIRGSLYNLNYFKESNVPEGFITLPEEVAGSKDEVEKWQGWFDDMLAGNSQFMHRLKILPGNSTYTPAKKPEDMAFERFEMWLLKQTCAVFDVQPQDIGITHDINKATGESQQNIGKERGLIPLANFIKEIFDDIIQMEFEYPDLQFQFTNINPVDRKEEVEIASKELEMGALSVDEYRTEHGREPIGLGPYIQTGKILVEDFIKGEDRNAEEKDAKPGQKPEEEEDPEKMEQIELKKWRKCIYTDIKLNRPLRKHFPSEWIKDETRGIIQEALKGVKTKLQAKLLFDQFLDLEVSASMKMLKIAANMRRIEDAQFTE